DLHAPTIALARPRRGDADLLKHRSTDELARVTRDATGVAERLEPCDLRSRQRRAIAGEIAIPARWCHQAALERAERSSRGVERDRIVGWERGAKCVDVAGNRAQRAL